MAKGAKEAYCPPDDPDFERLATEGLAAYRRDRPAVIAFDTETTGLTFADRPFCVTVAWYTSDGIENHYFELFKYDASEAVREILASTPTLIGHNVKFDLMKVFEAGLLSRDRINGQILHDTEASAHLDDEHRSKRLKDLAVSVLGYDDTITVELKTKPGEFKEVSREKHELDEVRRKLKLTLDDGFEPIPRGVLVPYALKDAEFTLELHARLFPRIERYPDLLDLYHQELELTRVLIDMELAGMAVDGAYVEEKVKEYTKRVVKHEIGIEQIVGRPVGKDTKGGEFNPQSNPQIRDYFEAAGFPREKYDEENLKTIEHPLAKALLELRGDAKLLNTYFVPLRDEPVDGILHPSFRQHGTVTGRMSSGAAQG